ncbi:MAG: hypothetical protein QMD13_09395 [Candidatus Bathyarchaeia archaeon]|nr:hypothetical protein [Candidatus Bathyarchaeia archaeon]
MKRQISLYIPYRLVIDDIVGTVKDKTFFSICEDCRHGHRIKAQWTPFSPPTLSALQKELKRKGLKLNMKRYYCARLNSLASFPKECKHYERQT